MGYFDFEDITRRLWLVQNFDYNNNSKKPRDGTKEFFFNTNIALKGRHAEIFRDFKNGYPFPVFADYVFKRDIADVDFPNDLFDRKNITGIRQNEEEIIAPGRVIVLKRKNFDKITKYFYVWISQSLLDKYSAKNGTNFQTNIHVIFHPKRGLQDCPPYENDSLAEKILNAPDRANPIYGKDKYFEKNYYTIGNRYLFSEKHSVLQHRCAMLKNNSSPAKDLSDQADGIPMMLIVPVTGNDIYFSDFDDALKLKEIVQAVSSKCFKILQKESGAEANDGPEIKRIACSFFSYSGHLAALILKNKRPDSIDEFYFFDPRFDNSNFEKMWKLLKDWKINAEKKIRIYSAYPAECTMIAQELRKQTHKEVSAPFARFNGKLDRNSKEKYGGLANGYEIYNEDKSTSLVTIPIGNFVDYGADQPKNPNGFYITDAYRLQEMNGHSWFIERLQSHALFHSGFKK